MLFWSAVLNGILAPPLVVIVVLLTSDRKVMGTRVNSRGLKILGWSCVGVMGLAVVAFFAVLR
jgi:Mn2+/Fe2+ NRAMP family transporter